jgi:geranylgeranyl pyrophosphate synthase
VPAAEQAPWRDFAEELGLLFQIVDDVLDGDGYAARLGTVGARDLAEEAAARARHALDAIALDTSVLRVIVDGLAIRTD